MDGKGTEKLKNESGGHRLQRVPPTEKRGRVHTSTVTVAIMSELKTVAEVRECDLKIEWYSGSGAGGQHRNKTQNSCRLLHIPTGITANAQTRSRQNSLNDALSVLRKRVKDAQEYRDSLAQSADRKDQMGSGMRGDKIRTYRFQDDQVKDHNTGKSATCTKVMNGYIDLLWN